MKSLRVTIPRYDCVNLFNSNKDEAAYAVSIENDKL